MANPDDPWNLHECNICRYKTRHLRYILSHVRLHTTRSEDHRFVCDLHSPEKYKCQKCDFQSDFKVLSTEHFATVHESKETQHYYPTPRLRCCENCDFQTYSSLVLLNHDNCCVGSFPVKEKTLLKLVKGKKHSEPQVMGGPPIYTNRKKDGLLHCTYCSYKTIRNILLKSHMLWKHTPSDQIDWFKCGICSYKSKTKSNLHIHMLRKKHIQSPEQKKPTKWLAPEKFHDNNCSDRSGNDISSTLQPSTSLENLTQVECRYHQPYKTKSPLHTNRKKGDFLQCTYCSYKTIKNKFLKSHMLFKHTPSDEVDWFKCGNCSYKSRTKSNLNIHMLRKKHIQPPEQKKRTKCLVPEKFHDNNCSDRSGSDIPSTSQASTSLENLKQLERRHHQPYKTKFPLHTNQKKRDFLQCNYCSYKAKYNRILKEHMLSKHTPLDQINWLECQQCFYKTKSKRSRLREHVLVMHNDPAEVEKLKKFKCDQCPYKALRSGCLRRHILRMHTPSDQINWFECEHCSFKAKEKHKLSRHLNDRHLTSPKMFECAQCSYKSKRKKNLKTHIEKKHIIHL